MMRALIGTSLRLRLPIVALAVILLVVGVRSTSEAPFDVFPEFVPSTVDIQTEAPGFTDTNGDGVMDIVTPSATGQLLVWIGSTGGTTFQLSNRSSESLSFVPQFLLATDLDGNGSKEILAVSYDGNFRVLLPERDFGF